MARIFYLSIHVPKRSRQSSTYIFYIEKESPFKKAPFWAIYDFRYVFFWFSRQFFFFSSFLLRDQVAAWDARILIYLRGKFLNAIRRGYHGLLLNRDRYWFQSTSICILIYCFLIKNTKGKKKDFTKCRQLLIGGIDIEGSWFLYLFLTIYID